MRSLRIAFLLSLAPLHFPLAPARAGVVINEVFYNAPGDLHELQWIELHNAGVRAEDLGGWTLDGGRVFVFPAGATLEAGGYLVVALDPELFTATYGVPAIGPLARPLGRGGGRLTLADARRRPADTIRYRDTHPWPASADGCSASLERITPSAPGELAENWAASPLPQGPAAPSGTPGKENAAFSAALPPVICSLRASPEDPSPGKSITIEAEVEAETGLRQVSLLYRIAGGAQGEETELPMARDSASGRFRAAIPGQPSGSLVRYRVRAVSETGARRLLPAAGDLRPTFSLYVHEPWEPAKIPLGFILGMPGGQQGSERRPGFGFFGRGPARGQAGRAARPPRGASTFVHVDPKSGKTTVFDHITVRERPGQRGFVAHFHKDLTLEGMTAASIIHEGNERFLLAEALAYDVYRRGGMPAPRADFLRLSVDGRPMGYYLMVERVNRSFLRHNRIDDRGNLYKLIWYGRGVIGQHDKRTNARAGHEDLLELVELLQTASADEEWRLIESRFNVQEVATYFAVNSVLSHWDGFFNNYFAYHDSRGTRKWEMFPWDQDKTWGYYDGLPAGEVFFDMPLTFGSKGDIPPGRRDDRPRGFGPFGGGTSWWRPAGHFSGPLLAHPRFRGVFLARLREILETVYTEAVYFPLLDGLSERLSEEAARAAGLRGEDPEAGVERLERNLESLRRHLVLRRGFLLAQEELRATRDVKAAPAETPANAAPKKDRER
jgi:hypothetical protein